MKENFDSVLQTDKFFAIVKIIFEISDIWGCRLSSFIKMNTAFIYDKTLSDYFNLIKEN